MGGFEKVSGAEDMRPGDCREVTAGGRTVALFNVEGTLYALSNRCSHRGGPLGQGLLEGCFITCPWHDWRYDVRTGEHSAGIESFRVPSYEVKVEDGAVWVRLGDDTPVDGGPGTA